MIVTTCKLSTLLENKTKTKYPQSTFIYYQKTNITAGQAEWGGSDKNIQKSTCVTRRQGKMYKVQDISQISKLLSLAGTRNKNNG